MGYRVQYRRDTAARWAEINPILLDGEIGYVKDNSNQYKMGDGIHAWNDLPLRGFNGTIAPTFGYNDDAVLSQKIVTEKFEEQDGKLSELGSNTGINQDSDYTSSVSIEGKYIHKAYGVLDSQGKRMSVPIAVNKNDIIRVYTSTAEAAEVVIGQCDENGNNIKPLVLGGKSGLSYYYAVVDFDGYIVVSCHITYYGLTIAKGGLGEVANQLRDEINSNILKAKEEVQKSASEDAAQKISALRVENISNTVWITNLNYSGDITSERLRYYQSIRNAKIVGYDIPISINLIWNGYGSTDNFRVRLLGKKDGAWSVIADTGNKPSSEVNPNHNGVLDIKIGGSSNFVQLSIDTSFIPVGDGTQFTKEGKEPEFVFSDNCYYESVSDEPSVVIENGTPAIPKLYPKHKLPCISFQFDDIVDEDDQIVSLFDEYNAKCNFAFMASESKIATYASKYLAWQKRGYGICNHSIDGSAFNTTNYPSVSDALNALMTAKNRLEAEGFVVNGFVSPSSTYYADASDEETRLDYLEAVEKTNAYAFTWSDSKNHSRESNPCRMTRYSIEANKIDAIKSWIDGYMNADKIVTLYGHSYNLGKLNTTSNEVFSIDKVREILEYIIAKRNAGELFFGNTDECVKYFFDL